MIVGGLLIFVQNSFHFYFWEYNREAVAETISTFVVEEGYSAAVWNPVWDKWMGAGIYRLSVSACRRAAADTEKTQKKQLFADASRRTVAVSGF